MNILYLTNHLNIGGITSYIFTLSRGLKLRGHNVYVASGGGTCLAKFTQEGASFIPIPIKTKSELSPKIIIGLFKLVSVVKQNRIDIVHSNSRTTQILGNLLSYFTHIPHIYTCHGFFKKRLSRRLFGGWGKRTIAISEAVSEHLVKDFGVRERFIRVIHNGIDVSSFREQRTENREQRKKDLGLGDGSVIGVIARLSEEKGHIYLIEAMAEVVSKIPETQLLIVGEGRMEGRLRDLTLKLGLEKKVYFMPSAMDIQELFLIIDIFVLPSVKEGLGLSLMEAMAAGLAVIGSDVGGIKALIKQGYNGLRVRPADVKGLSSAIIELLQDRERRIALGQNARAFITANFPEEKMVSQTEKLYRECLK